MLKLDKVYYIADDFTGFYDVEFPDQGMVILTGPSGGGKSTLLSLVAGFIQSQSGRILIANQDVATHSPSQRPLSLLFQEHNLFAHLTAFENAGLGLAADLRLDGPAKTKVEKALDRVGLLSRAQAYPAQLSGGERQRVAIARALLRDKPILLLDEPFSGLGPKLRRDMLDLILELQRENSLLVIMTSHEPDDIRRAADLAGLIVDGKLTRLLPPNEFFAQAELAYYL